LYTNISLSYIAHNCHSLLHFLHIQRVTERAEKQCFILSLQLYTFTICGVLFIWQPSFIYYRGYHQVVYIGQQLIYTHK